MQNAKSDTTSSSSLSKTPTDFLEATQELYDKLQGYNTQVNATLLLRSVLSPVLEAFILMDRWMYLEENGSFSFLVPLFDELLSPRNITIIAYKNTS